MGTADPNKRGRPPGPRSNGRGCASVENRERRLATPGRVRTSGCARSAPDTRRARGGGATAPRSSLSATRSPEPLALAVWPVAQVAPQAQRAGECHPDTFLHPGKMLPELARRIIETYSKPGDLVLDPMCGTGTTLIAAAGAGRRAIGVEIEERWAGVARANLTHALSARAASAVRIEVGDCREAVDLLPDLKGTVDLVATSPPYGCDAGVIAPYYERSRRKLTCSADGLNYSGDRANLGHARGAAYRSEMAKVYAACFELLRPGGLLVSVTKNTRRKGRCYDLLGETVSICEEVGFTYLQHVIAVHAAVRDGQLCSRPSYWQISAIRRAQARGEAAHLVVHEDVTCLLKSGSEARHGQ